MPLWQTRFIFLQHPWWRIVSAESSALLPSGIINTIVARSIGLALNGPFASIQPAEEVFGTHSRKQQLIGWAYGHVSRTVSSGGRSISRRRPPPDEQGDHPCR